MGELLLYNFIRVRKHSIKNFTSYLTGRPLKLYDFIRNFDQIIKRSDILPVVYGKASNKFLVSKLSFSFHKPVDNNNESCSFALSGSSALRYARAKWCCAFKSGSFSMQRSIGCRQKLFRIIPCCFKILKLTRLFFLRT